MAPGGISTPEFRGFLTDLPRIKTIRHRLPLLLEKQRSRIMPRSRVRANRSSFRSTPDRAKRPNVEGLESRILLYSALGDQWTYSSRITFSLMPDGTSVGGVPSTLFQTLNANYPTASWKQQIEYAASQWENVTNANLAMVSDQGEAVAVAGNQQDDPRFGDIRIGAIPLAAGTLAVTFLPPPANGGTDAGDILLNSNVNWRIGSNYDLMTVVEHEFGHALGLGDVSSPSLSSDVMYGTYTGIKTSLASDDIAGVQSIYGTRQYDQFNTGGQRDITYMTATNINSFVNNAQIAIPGLDITTAGDTEWFYVNVPSTTTGTMSVTVQSSNLSSLSPKIQVYNSSLGLVGQASTVGAMGATVSVSTTVQAGQGYYFKVLAAGGPGPVGGYGLLVNFGSGQQSPISPPNTVVAQQPDQGGGTANLLTSAHGPIGFGGNSGSFTSIGAIGGWTLGMTVAIAPVGGSGSIATAQTNGSAVFSAIGTTFDPNALATTQNTMTASLGQSSAVTMMTPTGTGFALAVLQALDEAIDQPDLLDDGNAMSQIMSS